ncbi:hypothetical protein D3C73_655750 [compost metagenome]
MKAGNTLAAGMVVVAAEQDDIIRNQCAPLGRMPQNCRGQHLGSVPVIGNHRGCQLTGKIDIHMGKAGPRADLMDTVRIRNACDKQRIDRIGDQGFHSPALFVRITTPGDNHGGQTAQTRLRLERLRHGGKEAIIVNRNQ